MIGLVTLASVLALSDMGQPMREARAALAESALALRAVEHCAARDAQFEGRFDALFRKQFIAQDRIEAFLGSGVRPEAEDIVNAAQKIASDCTEISVANAELRF